MDRLARGPYVRVLGDLNPLRRPATAPAGQLVGLMAPPRLDLADKTADSHDLRRRDAKVGLALSRGVSVKPPAQRPSTAYQQELRKEQAMRPFTEPPPTTARPLGQTLTAAILKRSKLAQYGACCVAVDSRMLGRAAHSAVSGAVLGARR